MKKIFSAICALMLSTGLACTAFADANITSLSVGQGTQEKRPSYADKGIETVQHSQSGLNIEVPKDWTKQDFATGTIFSSGSDAVLVQVFEFEKALASKENALAFLNEALNPDSDAYKTYDQVTVLSKSNVDLNSLCAVSAEFATVSDGSSLTRLETVFTSPGYKKYARIMMHIVNLDSVDEIGAEMSKILYTAGKEKYEMLLNSVKWDTPPAEQSVQPEEEEQSSSKTESRQTGSVYWTPGGKSYHQTRNCTSLKRSKTINSGTLQDAMSAGKSDPCNLCVR